MNKYFITWEIDVEADNATEAANTAWRLMRNEHSTANVFRITDCETGKSEVVDLQEINEASK